MTLDLSLMKALFGQSVFDPPFVPQATGEFHG